MRFILCLLLVLNSISAAVPSSCVRLCGKISIPFPFGIGDGCYLNDWYEVQCSKSVPFLPKINKELVQIDLPIPLEHANESFPFESIPFGSLRIKTNITSMGCSGGDRENSEEVFNFKASPFLIKSNNQLVAFGCNVTATLTHIDPVTVGCVSTCDITKELPTFSESGCDGYGCCNASTPREFGAVIGVKIESGDGGNTSMTCGVAFLTDEYGHPSLWPNRTDPKKLHARKYATIQLAWDILPVNLSFQESLRLRCSTDSLDDDFHSTPCLCYDDEFSYLRCACTSGYEGNPYDQDGCKDIDECKILEDGRAKHCNSRKTTCQNIPGSFLCVTEKNKTSIIYIGVSVGLGVLLVGVGIGLYKFIKKYRKTNIRKKFFKRNGGLLLKQQLASGEGSAEKTIIFSSKELEKATESFSLERVLGEGGQGTVFKGMLADGRIVAVKKSKVLDEDKVEEFINEVVVLSKTKHRNIVEILGCCLETEVPVLVYEYIPNDNLFEHLHNEDTIVTWEVRFRVAIEIARAISYLHYAASSPIYHKDIKSTNILLDEKYRAKLSDFGTSRVIAVDHTHLTTVVSGTVGYVDPEYFQSSQYTEKSDVYSYGVVLAELITGEKPRLQGNRTLASYFLVAMEEKILFNIIDPRIKEDCVLEQVTGMAKIARLCMDLRGDKRPNMRELLMELERLSSSQPEGQAMGIDSDEEEDTRRKSLNVDGASTSQTN